MTDPAFVVTHEEEGKWLVLRFARPHRMLSWAIVGGGLRTADTVAWRQVSDDELPIAVDPRALLATAMTAAHLSGAVALLTSSPLAQAVLASRTEDGLSVTCLTTVGLGNALRVGDPTPRAPAPVGTINLCLWLSHALSDEALIEAHAVCAEARTAALLVAHVPSVVSGLPATGTGTDCQIVAAPVTGVPLVFVGKHTTAGHLIGAAVGEAIATGIARWRDRTLQPPLRTRHAAGGPW